MKKRILILIIVLLFLLTPIPLRLKDGGTVEYTAILYKVTKRHAMTFQDDVEGYDIGTEIRVLWFDVYNDTAFVPGEQAD
jgi:hypothetical protein